MSFDPSLPEEGINVSRTHPLREAAFLVGGVLLVGAVAVVSIAFAVDRIVPLLPISLETKVFSSDWFAPDDADEAEPRAPAVQALVERLAAHWPENPYAFRAAVWEEEQPNALAFPGGLVVVTTGLLDAVESENELAFVLGHEIGHFADRDHLRGLGRGFAFALVLSAISFTGAGGAAELAGLSGGLAQRSFDREQEAAADRFGLELLAAEYGHVAHAWDFFERLPAPEGAVEEHLVHYLSTHPLSEERALELRALARERGFPLEGGAAEFATE